MPRLSRSFALALPIAAPLPALAQDATGLWRSEATEEGTIEVKIAPCGPALCGTILRARDLAGAEQPYPHSGKPMIWDMVADGPGQWSGGQIRDPRNGRTFASKIELAGNRLIVAGCVLGICQRQNWQRVN
jgi:uncharacterized protein (DUF2147 family)